MLKKLVIFIRDSLHYFVMDEVNAGKELDYKARLNQLKFTVSLLVLIIISAIFFFTIKEVFNYVLPINLKENIIHRIYSIVIYIILIYVFYKYMYLNSEDTSVNQAINLGERGNRLRVIKIFSLILGVFF